MIRSGVTADTLGYGFLISSIYQVKCQNHTSAFDIFKEKKDYVVGSVTPQFLSWYVMRCAIWYHLYNLKNVKNTYGGVLILLKLQASAYNFPKINTPPWVFSTSFKLYKWYQIAQRITYVPTNNLLIRQGVAELKTIKPIRTRKRSIFYIRPSLLK